ncbi:helix-turn-helix transcriptional regulator [Pseudidiomarina terrestris]|uniref:helix-turn-helix transcriptional regulator n=1 Tax=Pseudidiomarina terrestris TaxID=2820060 RepID=UPI00264BC5C2|nr:MULTISPECIES: AlpA family phage regulatory protein [unclassified Pseudidiomarina]MDN7135223.1 AlpA family phage regulatory protein [Pseudidiomarina sp. 1ASP75-5]MDN7137896.1 AlpA family phage regulatory protein [Pseudidiomarina sp. 1ASP75-14]
MNANQLKESVTIRRVNVPRYIGVSPTTLWDLEQTDSSFPRRIKLGKRGVAYLVSDLNAWLEAKKEG